jgi:hypothetical protein
MFLSADKFMDQLSPSIQGAMHRLELPIRHDGLEEYTQTRSIIAN